MELEFKRNKRITLIQVHGPTLGSEEGIVEKFYEDLQKTLTEAENIKHNEIIMGDFNSQIGEGQKGEEKIIGPYCYRKRNKNGESLIDFCVENNMKITNTWFKKKHNRRWTWISPNLKTKNQIDYFITNQKYKNIKHCGVERTFKCETDH